MRKLYCIIACVISQLSVCAQTAEKQDFLSIKEAMSIVSYRRNHPIADHQKFDGFVKSIFRKYAYRDEDFLEGVGTCDFWQYIKNGHTVYNVEPLDDDYFIPDNIQEASAVAVVDCQGIETIEYDETAISVEMRVFSVIRRDEIMKEMRSLGFAYKKEEYYGKVYVWDSYTISLYEGKSRGHKYWRFEVSLNPRNYNTTKHYEYSDSSSAYNLKIHMDYPVSGNVGLQKRVRTFIMEALEQDLLNGGPLMGRFNGDPSDGQAVINYYGVKGCTVLKEKHNPNTRAFKEETSIKKIAENDYFVSYEVLRLGWYGGVLNVLNYGASFRKSDGKRLHVISNPDDPQFKHFLNNQVFFEKKDEVNEEYRNNLPMPEYAPYLIQSGVRFVYQKYEIAPGAAEHIKGDSSFSEISKFLSDEVIDVLK